MATLGTHLYTALFGSFVGRDEYGNRYYQSRSKKAAGVGRIGSNRRWVIYAGVTEPSLIPPLWHAWIHHISDQFPVGQESKQSWQKQHLPSLTGSSVAYLPNGHEKRGGKRDKATGDYQAWTPKQ